MPSFTLTKKALADLIEIGRYTQKRWGTEQRDTYLTMLDSCFQQLAVDPLTGRACDEIRSGYRKMNAGSHVEVDLYGTLPYFLLGGFFNAHNCPYRSP